MALTFGWGPFKWAVGYLKALLLSRVSEYHGGMSDNDKMISDEAVEAAAKATFVHANLGSAWEDAQPDWQDAYRASVRAGLEAAAPRMLAEKDAEIAKLRAHILDIDAHATPFGDIPDDPGYVGAYLVSAGSLHRALGKIGHAAPSCEAEAKIAMDDALRMYGDGVALSVITERTGISYSGLMKAKKDRGIPNRPQRADGTNRSQA